jgi:hypothetical protein
MLPRQRWSVFLVTPGTLLRWHPELVARRWTYPHTGEGSTCGLDSEAVRVVLRLARENPRWGTCGSWGKPASSVYGVGDLGPADSAPVPLQYSDSARALYFHRSHTGRRYSLITHPGRPPDARAAGASST